MKSYICNLQLAYNGDRDYLLGLLSIYILRKPLLGHLKIVWSSYEECFRNLAAAQILVRAPGPAAFPRCLFSFPLFDF